MSPLEACYAARAWPNDRVKQEWKERKETWMANVFHDTGLGIETYNHIFCENDT